MGIETPAARGAPPKTNDTQRTSPNHHRYVPTRIIPSHVAPERVA